MEEHLESKYRYLKANTDVIFIQLKIEICTSGEAVLTRAGHVY